MKPLFRSALPQLSGNVFLTDAGLETDLIFNHGIDMPEFAAHTLLPKAEGRVALANYLRGFLSLARKHDTGYILDSQTWRAQRHWCKALGVTPEELRRVNHEAIRFIASLRNEYATNRQPIVLNAVIGPKGDAYTPEAVLSADEAEAYHAEQVGWLAETEVDMITGLTFTQSDEAVGLVRAAAKAFVPVAISFTVETDGRLPTGQPLAEAIDHVDSATGEAAAYFMVNCAHPDHFADVLDTARWARRIRGVRCNASRMSHAELDECETLDDGNPHELAEQYKALKRVMPWLNIFGGCCGSDLRHVTEIADAVVGEPMAA